MILRRLAAAIRRQDWFVVTVELLVVVVGIFLGLRVDDWNEARKERQREATYLERLAGDVAAMRNELVGHAERAERRYRAMIEALRALEACESGRKARSAVEFAFANYQISPAVGYLGATYDEMVSTGALARMRDVDLKEAIAGAFSHLGELGERIANYRVSMSIVDAIAWRHVSYGLDADERPTVAFDIAELCENREVRNAVAEMVDIQWDSLALYRTTLSRLDRLLEAMAAHGLKAAE